MKQEQAHSSHELDTTGVALWLKTSTTMMISVAGIETAWYVFPTKPNRPTYLFVHGISGDYQGMGPLAMELKDDVNVIMVDLPSHGSTGMLLEQTSEALLHWARDITRALTAHNIRIDGVIAHSLGCMVAQQLDVKVRWYLNPPLIMRRLTKFFSLLLFKLDFLMKIYELRPIAYKRGLWLLHEQSARAVELTRWSTIVTKKTETQIKAQLRLGYVLSMHTKFAVEKHPFTGVVFSRHDNVTVPVKTCPEADKIVHLEVGHITIFESITNIAELVRDQALSA